MTMEQIHARHKEVLKLAKTKLGQKEIAEKTGYTIASVSVILASYGVVRDQAARIKPTKKQIEKVKRLRAEGKTIKEVAAALRRSPAWIRTRVIPLTEESNAT